jgi:hypothetical protein
LHTALGIQPHLKLLKDQGVDSVKQHGR